MRYAIVVWCAVVSLVGSACGKAGRPLAGAEDASDESVVAEPDHEVHTVDPDEVCQSGPDNVVEPCSIDAGRADEDAGGAADAGHDATTTARDAGTTGVDAGVDSGCAAAEASLFGSVVSMTVAYPTTASPISNTMTAVAGSGIEFPDIQSQASTHPVVAADVDLESHRIIFRYKGSGPFAASNAFNGYVFGFSGLSRAIARATIDPATSPELRAATAVLQAGRLLINVASLAVTTTSVLAVSLEFADCGGDPQQDAGQAGDAGTERRDAAADAGPLPDACSAAQQGLTGTALTMTVAYQTPANAISNALTAFVGAGVEFGSIEQQPLPGYRIGAADVDVEERRVVFRYKEGLTFPSPGGGFNGYVFTGLSAGVVRAEVDSATSPELRSAPVTLEPGRLTINVQGLTINAASVLSVSLSFAPCSL